MKKKYLRVPAFKIEKMESELIKLRSRDADRRAFERALFDLIREDVRSLITEEIENVISDLTIGR